MAGSGHGQHQGVPGGRCPSGDLQEARGGGGGGAVGAARVVVHYRVRGPGRAWLVAHAAKSAVQAFARVSWRAVTGVVERVVGEARGRTDRLAGLTRVGIDEKSYRKGHKYLTVVTDHDTGRVVWTADGRSKATVAAFFAALGPERAAGLTHVSADGADWIHGVVAEHAPGA